MVIRFWPFLEVDVVDSERERDYVMRGIDHTNFRESIHLHILTLGHGPTNVAKLGVVIPKFESGSAKTFWREVTTSFK
jgi:hypothetical protein